ncbi:MAG: hypothetical protein KIT14_01005 [bacterium]|nr:hypothetical protein [bacterium]
MSHRTSPAAVAIAVLVALAAGGCAARRPVLYQDAAVNADLARADAQVGECESLASTHEEPNPAPQVAQETLMGAVIGTVGGVVGGAVWGNPGVGAAAGAAGGAAASLFNAVVFRPLEPSPIYRSAVETCLADHGYRVVGWR